MAFDSHSSAFAAGQKVGAGRFTLERLLGRGGMGVVWLARDARLGEAVALKFLSSELQSDAKALEQMRLETLKSRKLSHPHIVRIHDFHQEPGEPVFISMEYVDGCTLTDLAARQPGRLFSWDSIRAWMLQLCEALAYAHSQQIIHRDLKPANMMIDRAGALKLSDFGIAAAASDTVSRLTHQRKTSGTPAYMSPQQMDGRSPRVSDDIYSLGCVIYELLTSTPPFFRGDIWRQVQSKDAEPMEERLKEFAIENTIPEAVGKLVKSCLEKEAELRPQSMEEVRRVFEASGDAAVGEVDASGPRQSERGRRRLALAVALVCMGTLVAAGLVWNSRSRGDGDAAEISATGESESAAGESAFTLSEEALLRLRAPNRGRRDPVDVPGPGVDITFNIAPKQLATYTVSTGMDNFSKFRRFGLKFTLLKVEGGRAGDLIIGVAAGISAKNAKTKIGVLSLSPQPESKTLFVDLNTDDVGILGFTARQGAREWGKKAVTITMRVEPVTGLETYPFGAAP